MSRLLSMGLFLLFVCTSVFAATNNPFPHRAKYKDVPVIAIDRLKGVMNQVLIIDVRSKYEYNTLHIKGAAHVPLNNATFAAEVSKLQKIKNRKVVFYCNGGKCRKSYKAVKKAQKAGLRNCAAYDAGIYAWAKRYPGDSVLLGQSPMQASAFIEDQHFKSRLISAKDFESKKQAGGVVLDIRDRPQRDTQLFPFEEQRAELKDIDRIHQIVSRAKRGGKTLLVYDKVGKQVRWFQYFLEQRGVKNYYFMRGGSEGYYEEKLGPYRFDVKTNAS